MASKEAPALVVVLPGLRTSIESCSAFMRRKIEDAALDFLAHEELRTSLVLLPPRCVASEVAEHVYDLFGLIYTEEEVGLCLQNSENFRSVGPALPTRFELVL